MDTIADMLTIIRNGYLARKQNVEVVYSQQNESIVKKLTQLGFLESSEKVETEDKKKKLKLKLIYTNSKPALEGIERISKPSVRIYSSYSKIPKVLGGLGKVIISTPKGVLTGNEARKSKIGGELILKVW
jgi:small subunit ribosomal protein S8